jgi:outer membrane immunogenic protein
MKLAIATVAVAALAGAAHAESEFYINGGYSAFDGEGATLDGITARGGVFFNDYFGVEGEASFGLGEDEIEPGVDLELSNQFAGYVIGRLPLGENFDLFARAGYGSAEFDVSSGDLGGSADVDGFAGGVGGQFFFTEQFGVRGEYTRFEADDEDLDGGLDVFSVSAVFRF